MGPVIDAVVPPAKLKEQNRYLSHASKKDFQESSCAWCVSLLKRAKGRCSTAKKNVVVCCFCLTMSHPQSTKCGH